MQIHEDIRFQTLIERMEALHLEGQMEEMQLLLEELQTLSETEQDNIGLAASYFYHDILSEDTLDSPTYCQYATRAFELSKAQNIPYYLMKSSNSLGIMYSELSDFHASLDYYLRALHIADEHPEFHYAAIVLNNVGNLFVWLKDYADAAVYLERAYYRSIMQNKNDRGLLDTIILNLIELYSVLEDDQKVRQWEALSQDILDQDARKLVACIIFLHDARALIKDGNTAAAVKKIRILLNLSLEISDYIYIFHCYVNAIRLCIEMKDFQLSSTLMTQLEQLQKNASMTSFAYDYATVRIEYYHAFRNLLDTDSSPYYQEYYLQSQNRIDQLHNTYAKSLSVKIAFEAVKDEKQNVQRRNEQLTKDMELDIFTNLYNKVSTEKYVIAAMKERLADTKQALLLIDIDLFKRINDNYGHIYGDQVITQVASILNALDNGDKIAGRFGGDEFLIFLKQQDSVDSIKAAAEILLTQVKSSIKLPDDRVNEITLSIGICVIDSDTTFEQAFALADDALYLAKENGRNQYQINIASMAK